MIKLDFQGSTHGHFLEYITNVYIMKTTCGSGSVFSDTGASHSTDDEYKRNRKIVCGHYSLENRLSIDDIVIKITIDDSDDRLFYIASVNSLYRGGDIGVANRIKDLPIQVSTDPALLRGDFYSKFIQRDIYANHYSTFKPSTTKSTNVFEFPFHAFYSFGEFCKNLQSLARFLNQTAIIDSSLYEYWAKFIELNQGIASYNKCCVILENVFANKDYVFQCEPFEEGWLNYNLTKMCDVYDGLSFTADIYPNNCQTLYAEIQRQMVSDRNL